MDNIFFDPILFSTDLFGFDEDEDEIERRPYTIRTKVNHFEFWDDIDFFARFRLKKQTFLSLLSKIECYLIVSWNK